LAWCWADQRRSVVDGDDRGGDDHREGVVAVVALTRQSVNRRQHTDRVPAGLPARQDST